MLCACSARSGLCCCVVRSGVVSAARLCSGFVLLCLCVVLGWYSCGRPPCLFWCVWLCWLSLHAGLQSCVVVSLICGRACVIIVTVVMRIIVVIWLGVCLVVIAGISRLACYDCVMVCSCVLVPCYARCYCCTPCSRLLLVPPCIIGCACSPCVCTSSVLASD